MNPLNIQRNDYRKNKKNSTIYTPAPVARFLFDVLHESVWNITASKVPVVLDKGRGVLDHSPEITVFDPAIGSGRLTDPWIKAGYRIIGCDIAIDPILVADETIKGRFEDCTWYDDWPTPDLVLCNPPFNGATGKRLYPEVFLEHIFELFGPKQPVVLFAPMGLRLNQRRKSKRFRWLRDCGAELTSIISLPLDTFDGVEFHVEVLIWNVKGIKPHYYLTEEAL